MQDVLEVLGLVELWRAPEDCENLTGRRPRFKWGGSFTICHGGRSRGCGWLSMSEENINFSIVQDFSDTHIAIGSEHLAL